jgi:hypothetical protein
MGMYHRIASLVRHPPGGTEIIRTSYPDADAAVAAASAVAAAAAAVHAYDRFIYSV